MAGVGGCGADMHVAGHARARAVVMGMARLQWGSRVHDVMSRVGDPELGPRDGPEVLLL